MKKYKIIGGAAYFAITAGLLWNGLTKPIQMTKEVYKQRILHNKGVVHVIERHSKNRLGNIVTQYRVTSVRGNELLSEVLVRNKDKISGLIHTAKKHLENSVLEH